MVKFIEKNYKVIVLVILMLVFGTQVTAGIAQATFPGLTEKGNSVIRVIIQDTVREEISPLAVTIVDLETKIDVLYFNAADEWVRQITKQHDKLKKNADNLYWDDVAYVISKWPQMPESYKTPEMLLLMEYIEHRYSEHINGKH